MTVFRILFHPNAIEICYALHRLIVNFFADLVIYNAESIQSGLQQWSKVACLQRLVLSIASGLFSVEGCRQVRRRAINIALGQYWFLLLLHGFIPPGPGQYGVLLPWLEEVT